MFELILLSALTAGPCEGGQCAVTVATSAGISVAVQTEAEYAKASRAPVRKVVSVVCERRPVRTRIARLREGRPVRRVLGRFARRCCRR